MLVTRWLAVLWCLVVPASGWAGDLVELPPLTARVTDLTATLDADQRATLEASLAKIEREHGAQVAILMLPSTRPESIEQFGIRLAEAWKLGRQRVDDGAIIIVAKGDHSMRIEVGRGLEGAVPDVVAKRIVADVMAPKFKQGDFAGGLELAIADLASAIAGEALPAPAAAKGGTAGDSGNLFWLFVAIMAGGLLRSLLGLAGVLVVALAAGWLAWTIFASWLAAIVVAGIVALFSYLRGNGRGWATGGPGGIGGGGWGSGSGWSSGSGGFSGGGGGFGGGGASGNW